jgi:hypothetical protein
MTRQLRVAVLSGLFLLSSLSMVHSVRAQDPPSRPQPVMDQMTNIPYFTVLDGMSSTLTLNNVSSASTPVTVTIYNLEGKSHVLDPIVLDAHSFKQIDLRDVVNDEFSSGSIEVAFNGIAMGVTCQVSVFSLKNRVSFESREQDVMDFDSANLAGILSLPKGADGFLAVTNVSNNRLTFQLTAGSLKKTAALSPRETELIKLNDDERLPRATLVKLQHSGLPGDLITTGYVLNLDTGYSSGFAMLDPSINRSATLAGAHFRVGKPDPSEGFPEDTRFRSPLLIANVSAGPVMAHVSVDYTVAEQDEQNDGDSKTSSAKTKHTVVKVADVAVAPGNVQRVELSDALGSVGRIIEAGVDIAYDAAPGSVIAQLTSVDQSGDYSFEVPIKDANSMTETLASVYPFNLENGNNTVLHLKNTTGQSVSGIVLIGYYDGGIDKTYNWPPVVLEPYQTIAIDIQKLQDSKKPDVRGVVFPGDVKRGQIEWIQRTPNTMIGRAEQTNVKEGIASSFSCNMACCQYFSQSDSLSPSGWSGSVGESFVSTALAQGIDCTDRLFGPSPDGSASNWYAPQVPPVATVTSSGFNTGMATVAAKNPGSTVITATISHPYYTRGGTLKYPYCNFNTKPQNINSNVTVYPPTHLHIISDSNGYLTRCPVTYVMNRDITLQVQDQYYHPVGGAPVQENFIAISSNTCGGNPPGATKCFATDSTGTFVDTQTVGICNVPFHGCGWTLTDEWQWCPAYGTVTNLANMSPEFTHDDQLQMKGLLSPVPAGSSNFNKLTGDIFP